MTKKRRVRNDKKKRGRGQAPPLQINVEELTFLVFPLQYGGSALTATNAGGGQAVFSSFDV